MMPGENHSKKARLVSNKTAEMCSNCTLLHETLKEYLEALLALKQNSIDSDHLLTEYQRKCDELQTSQRETSKLHLEVCELQLKVAPLQKQHAEFQAMRAELETKQSTEKLSQRLSEEFERLKMRNSNTETLKKRLEDQLKTIAEKSEKQTLENVRLRKEKTALDEELKRTETVAKEVQHLKEENARTSVLILNLEKQLRVLEDCKMKQECDITKLKTEKILLEKNLLHLQERIEELEKKQNKEINSISTQATPPEPKFDKEKVRRLLEELWVCVDPPPSSHFPVFEHSVKTSSHRADNSSILPVGCSFPLPSCGQLHPPILREPVVQSSPSISVILSPLPQKKNDSDFDNKHITDVQEILDWFKPLPPVLSPMPCSAHEGLDDALESVAGEHTSDLQKKNNYSVSTTVGSTVTKPGMLNQTAGQPEPANQNSLGLIRAPSQFVHALPGQQLKDSLFQRSSNRTLSQLPVYGKFDSAPSLSTEIPVQRKSRVYDIEERNRDAVLVIGTSCGNPVGEQEDMQVESATQTICPPSGVILTTDVDQTTFTQFRDFIPNTLISPDSLSVHSSTPKQEAGPAEFIPDIDEAATVPDEVVPGPDEVAPGPDEVAPGPDEVAPGPDEVAPGPDEVAPGPDEVAPGPDEVAPGPDEVTPGPDEVVPVKDEVAPVPDEVAPVPDEVKLGPYEVVPGPDEVVPVADEVKPGPDELTASVHNNTELKTGKLRNLDKDTGSDVRNPQPPNHLQNIEPLNNPTSLQEQQDMKTECISENTTTQDYFSNSSSEFQRTDEIPEEQSGKLCEMFRTGSGHVRKSLVKSNTIRSNSIEDTSVPSNIQQLAVNSSEMLIDTVSPDVGGDESTTVAESLRKSPADTGLGKVRSEMGPPLPTLLMPLTVTPPRPVRPVQPAIHRHDTRKRSFSSTMEGTISPAGTEKEADGQKWKCPSLVSVPPSSGVPSFPLMFGSATPKHAVPVPGRLPSCSSSSSPAQENSMTMLDSMYPEHSARAQTLSILRGNLSLCTVDSGSSSISQPSGFKTVNSLSTAFSKTDQSGKRRDVNMILPKRAKGLRLANGSPSPDAASGMSFTSSNSPVDKGMSSIFSTSPDTVTSKPQQVSNLEKVKPASKPVGKALTFQHIKPVCTHSISQALEKISTQCFDLLPAIKSHLLVGNLSRKPVLRDEEREVIAEFTISKSLGDDLMAAMLTKLNAEKNVLGGSQLQALVRVYTALCRQSGDWNRAHIMAYSILKEDFPESVKLILFMVTTWPSVFSCPNVLCRAIHTVTKLKAVGEVFHCLTAYMGWEKSPPSDLNQMVFRTVTSIRAAVQMSFQKHPRQGQDLNPVAWQHIFTLELLCSQTHWTWTHDNLLSQLMHGRITLTNYTFAFELQISTKESLKCDLANQELWPIMNSWVTQPRSGQMPIKDVTVAAVLRLIGRLGQLGIKERCNSSVRNIASVINTFIRHGQSEGVPWEVQLAAIYTVYDLSPSNPKEALAALASWRGETTEPVPPAVTSCITQIASLCRHIKI